MEDINQVEVYDLYFILAFHKNGSVCMLKKYEHYTMN